MFETVAKLSADPSYNAWFSERVLFNGDRYFFEEGLFDYASEKRLWDGFSVKYLVEDELNGKWFEHRHLGFNDVVAR